MKAHTAEFKENIKKFGKEINSKITYTLNGEEIVLGNEDFDAISPHYEGALLKSVMKQLDLTSNTYIAKDTTVNYHFGVKVREATNEDDGYDYANFGNYIVAKEPEKQEDMNKWKITCYDKMLLMMTPYEKLPITYPITVRDYINAICLYKGVVFKNANDEFVNYDKVIENELYLDEDGNDLGYTFRTVLDELAQVTASTICINEETDELEVRYINQTIGKNLFDISKADYVYKCSLNNDICTSNLLNIGDRSVNFGSIANNNFVIEPGETYYVSADIRLVSGTANTSNALRFSVSGLTNTMILNPTFSNTFQRYSSSSTNNGSSSLTSGRVLFQPNNANLSNGIFEIKNVMISKSIDTNYEPYGDTINEEYLKDINVNFGEKYGPINTVVLSRSAGSDKIALSQPENLPDDEKNAIEISDNQIMNFNNRDEFLPNILNKLYGLQYYVNDFSSPGIMYYSLCDKYNISIGENIYNCIMLNDDISVTQGLEENVFTDLLEESKTDYTKVSKTDRTISQTTLIVDKQARNIEALVYDMYDENGKINESFTNVRQEVDNITTNIQSSGGTNLLLNSVMFSYINDEVLNWEITGIGSMDILDSPEAKNAGGISGHIFVLNDMLAKQRINVKADSDTIPEEEKTYYTFSTKIKKDINGTCYVKIYNNNEEYLISVGQGENPYFADYEIASLLPKDNYYDIEFYGSAGSNATFTDNMFTIGKYKKQWSQANGEIMNTQVAVDINGLHVRSATNEGTEVIITPFEFSGYAKVDGVQKKIFTLNGATTEVEKIKSRSEINMPPLKIVPITSGTRTGWAFVPTAGGDN